MSILLFAKHLAGLDLDAMADEIARSGADGVDVPVRMGHAVTPVNIGDTLPRLSARLAARGKHIGMCTGEGHLLDSDDPGVAPLLAAMQACGVPLLKLGYFRLGGATTYWGALDEARRRLAGWERAGALYNVKVCYHTHSGPFLGGTAATVHQMLRGLDPRHVGAYLDAGHLSIGGELFDIACDIVGDYLSAVAIKDVVSEWREESGRRAVARRAVPLGQGLTDLNLVLAALRRRGFGGPLVLHCEYAGAMPEVVARSHEEIASIRAAFERSAARDAE